MPLRILGAGIFGGPMGILGAAVMGLVQTLFAMGPDTSRPPTPAGMSETGSESQIEPVTPGTAKPGQYTTLATTVPEFLQGATMFAGGDPARGVAAYQQAAQEWRWTEAVEKGLT